MADSQAGESSQAQQNKMPWEASFWGMVDDTIPQKIESPKEAPKKPWEAGFWLGNRKPTPKGSTKRVTVERAEMVVSPEEQAKRDAESKQLPRLIHQSPEENKSAVQAYIRELDGEIKRAKDPKILKILQDERKRLLNAR